MTRRVFSHEFTRISTNETNREKADYTGDFAVVKGYSLGRIVEQEKRGIMAG
jgi:hypothetical protein